MKEGSKENKRREIIEKLGWSGKEWTTQIEGAEKEAHRKIADIQLQIWREKG